MQDPNSLKTPKKMNIKKLLSELDDRKRSGPLDVNHPPPTGYGPVIKLWETGGYCGMLDQLSSTYGDSWDDYSSSYAEYESGWGETPQFKDAAEKDEWEKEQAKKKELRAQEKKKREQEKEKRKKDYEEKNKQFLQWEKEERARYEDEKRNAKQRH